MGEFDLIETYFKKLACDSAAMAVDLGIGDDCALVTVPEGKQLAISSDTLVSGVHFPSHTQPEDIGYKSLAVNLSDLAAMGAQPAWFSLCLSLPNQDEAWIARYCEGLQQLIQQVPITLIGGDTTRSDQLTISIQVMGLVDQGDALTRSGASVDDDIYVSGRLGEGGLGLFLEQKKVALEHDDFNVARRRLNRPLPRNLLAQHIQPYASACIDVSDGLLADLNHVLTSSQVAAHVELNRLPLAEGLLNSTLLEQIQFPLLDGKAIQLWAASAGDDYELCFTAPEHYRAKIASITEQLMLPVTRFGKVVEGQGIREAASPSKIIQAKGFQHF